MDLELPDDEFLEVLLEKLKKFLLHHFIYKHQESFLKNKKETLSDNECIIILDFAENTFMVHDTFSSFIVTLRQWHILLLFIANRMELWNTRIWHVSVICFNMMCIQFTHFKKQSFLMLWKMIYLKESDTFQWWLQWTDENQKNVANLLHHSCNYALYAEWHFFAMPHGKNACKGIFGTIKQIAACASLQQWSVTGQILSAKSLFQFANSEIPGIQLFWIPTQKQTSSWEKVREKQYFIRIKIQSCL